jgi:micrococcal nuclease
MLDPLGVMFVKTMRLFIMVFTLTSLLLQANLLLAEVYRSQDSQGRVIFSDRPSADATRIPLSTAPYRYKHHVVKVYDGDTLVLKNGQRVRLLGLNTPEIESHFRQGEQGGMAAKKWLSQKLAAKDVFLEFDIEQRDKYKRLLAHVFIDDEHINLSLLEQGLAMLSIIPPNVRYSDKLVKAQSKAERSKLGLWADEAYQAIDIERDELLKLKKGWQRFIVEPKRLVESRKYLRLIISERFEIRIKKTEQNLFPDLNQYINKRLEVRGWTKRKGDKYSLLLLHPSSLVILD